MSLFLPKLQSKFAEFLQRSYLERLSMFYLSTCVGLGYGLNSKYCFQKVLKYYNKSLNYNIIQTLSHLDFLSAYTFVICLKDRLISDSIKRWIGNLRFTATMIKHCFSYLYQYARFWCLQSILQLTFLSVQNVLLP